MFEPTDIVSSTKWWPVRNTHATDAPPHAVLLVVGVADGCINVTRPDEDSLPTGRLMVNSGGALPAGAEGVATPDLPTRIAYSPDGGSGSGGSGSGADFCSGEGTDPDPPVMPEDWGTEADSWELARGQVGFVAWGGADRCSAVFNANPDLAAGTGSGSGSGGSNVWTVPVESCNPSTGVITTTTYRITFPRGTVVERAV